MITFELLEYKNERYVYSFAPDLDPNAKGKIAIYDDGNCEVLEQSSVDVQQYYASHALWGIYAGEEKGTVAWC